jgi:hypothetical protein
MMVRPTQVVEVLEEQVPLEQTEHLVLVVEAVVLEV